MRTFPTLAVLTGSLALSACVSATSTPSYSGKEAEWVDEIEPLLAQLANPNSRTLIGNLDLKTGVYEGVLHGSSEYDGTTISQICNNECVWDENAPWSNYIADAKLQVDLQNQENFTGTLSNFLTELPGYKSLLGVVEFSGNVSETTVNGSPAVVFNNMYGDGTLRAGNVDVVYVELSGGGAIIGSFDGAYATGFLMNDFLWLPGTPFNGQSASWDGALFLIRK
jgi:hypothetical protein